MRKKISRTSQIFISLVALAIAIPLALPASADLNALRLDIKSLDTLVVQVRGENGERGAALARLPDGRLLLGGGKTGLDLYLFDLNSQSLELIGRAGKSSERINDSRFAITDIAILSTTPSQSELLISYPQYDRSKRCVSVVVYSYKANFTATPSLKRGAQWFKSKPCVAISAVQHAAGRFEVINKTSAYLTIGDLGFPKIGDKKLKGDLGSVFKISAAKIEKISSGHRNAQGIVAIGANLYTAEHGPRGGDELNLIKKGLDYGWPNVSLGQPYSAGDYVKPTITGRHDGYEPPIYYWVPSVAPTELIQLPSTSKWGVWAGQIVMGTLAQQALIFIQMQDVQNVGLVLERPVDERIRDLDVALDGAILATTDSGKVLVINPGK